jgi:type VI secretion system secreted protein Hcp
MAFFDAFLKVDGIKSESADLKHKGEIDVMNFSWGAFQGGSQATGGGGGTGKVHFTDISIVKRTDASSPLLMLACANGSHYKLVTISMRKAGRDALEYLKITLTDVLVTKYQTASSLAGIQALLNISAQQRNGQSQDLLVASQKQDVANQSALNKATADAITLPSHKGDEIPVELVSFNFAKVEMQYQPQGADGAAQGGPIIAGWDVKGNVKA